ncbi:MAG TPA: DUF2568 domain-containing protein [Gaiellales bacterium]|nr:DUF2568 domain-containing protein [Gaiellales bacterium]
MSAIRGPVLAVRFLLELALLAGAAVAGWRAGGGGFAGALLAVLGVLVVAVLWGRAIAPRARRRWPDPKRLILELVIFILVGGALAATGSPAPGLALAVASAAVAVAVRPLAEAA